MADDDFSQFEVSGPVRVMSEWVPGEQRTHATQYGPDEQHLVSGASAAVSPDLAQGHELHEPFELYQNGKLVGEYSYDDASYYSPGNPTSNSIERYGLPELEGPHSIKWLGKEAASNFGDYEQGANPFAQYEVQAPKTQAAPKSIPTVVDPTGEAAAGTMAGEGPGTQGRPDRPLPVTPKDPNDFKQFESLGAEHPIAQQHGWNLVSWVTGLIDTAKRDYLSQKLGDLTGRQAEQSKFGTLGSDPYEERIKEVQIDPNLNAQQRDETIASIRVEQAREQQKKVAAIPQAHKDLQEAQAKVDKDHPDWKQQTIASLLTLAPNMMAGPMAPFTMAQQAIAQTYGDQLDGAVKKYKDVHPGASDKEAYTEAVNAVSDAARASGGSMLALGLLGDIPAFGGMFARIAQHIGWGAATMEVGNTLAEFERNRAFKEYVDPKQELTERIKDLDFHVKNMAIGGVLGGVHGVGSEIGRPSHVPIEDRVPIAEVPDTKEPEPTPEPEKVTQAAVRYKGQVETGNIHADAVEKLLDKLGKVDQDDFYKNSESGYVTDKGRFIDRKEADELTGRGIDSLTVVDPIQQPPVTGTDPWLSSIANRYVEPRVAAGEIGEITPGRGTSAQAQLARGLQMGPEEIAQHVSDVMQGKGTGHGPALRAREAQLSQEARNASIAAEQNPNDPQAQAREQETFEALTEFHNGPMKKFKESASEEMRSLQGRIEVDLSSFNGLREQWLRDVGKEPSKDVQAKMRDTARKVREAQAAEQNAMKTLSDEIDRQTARRKLPTSDEVRTRIMERVKDFPCVT